LPVLFGTVLAAWNRRGGRGEKFLVALCCKNELG
jgi:hypothetical protein